MFNNKGEIVSGNSGEGTAAIVTNEAGEKVFVIKFGNVELHGEEGTAIAPERPAHFASAHARKRKGSKPKSSRRK